MIVALYARVSTDKQDELNQLPQLRHLAMHNGYRIFGEYTDIASGRSKANDRPGWQKLMKDARAGNFDRILVIKLDRVMRSLKQLLSLLEILDELRISLECGDIGIIDTKSSAGKLQMQIVGAVAEWEAGIISERTRSALAAKKARGIKLGRPIERGFDFETAARLIMSGHSREQVAKKLNVTVYDINNRRKQINETIEQIKKEEENLW